MSDHLPIIKLQLQNMKHSIAHAFHAHHMTVDRDVQEAIERFCDAGHVKRIIEDEVSTAIEWALKEEVRAFFKYGGEGREVIRKAVRLKLLKEEELEASDE